MLRNHMANNRPLQHDHLYRLKMSSALLKKLAATATKARRTLPDFMRLVLEDAVAEPQDQSLRGNVPDRHVVFGRDYRAKK